MSPALKRHGLTAFVHQIIKKEGWAALAKQIQSDIQAAEEAAEAMGSQLKALEESQQRVVTPGFSRSQDRVVLRSPVQEVLKPLSSMVLSAETCFSAAVGKDLVEMSRVFLEHNADLIPKEADLRRLSPSNRAVFRQRALVCSLICFSP